MSVTIELGEILEKRLKKMAKLSGKSASTIIREALEEELAEVEGLYLAEQRLNTSEGVNWTLEQLECGEDLIQCK